jgi:uncharacterized protein YuzE
MKLHYYPDTDSLYIELSEKPSIDSQEITDEVVIDFDEQGNLVGIDIDNASSKLNLQEITAINLPQILTKV